MFVSGVALIAAARFTGIGLPGEARAAQAADLDAFMALSKTLTESSALDGGMGNAVYEACLDAGMGETIGKLVTDPADKASAKVANQIVAAWYSGMTPDGKGVTDFTEALVWKALSFSKPWGMCGGAYGYWGDAPAEQ
ncbi:sugar dehydrogenase complex small subunit [Paracoccus aminophilus]|nr:sugar dehydrogenase complex small subunit [Paracoccus aminophilus]